MTGNDYHFQKYFEALAEHMTPDQLRKLLKWGTPEEWMQILEEAESPQEVIRVLRLSRSMVKREERIAWATEIFAATGRWIVWMGGAVLLFRQVWPLLSGWFQR